MLHVRDGTLARGLCYLFHSSREEELLVLLARVRTLARGLCVVDLILPARRNYSCFLTL